MTSDPGQTNRFDRRRAKTRAALVSAAQAFLAEGQTGAPIQKVTERADVGIGTFYNHFASKEELFEVAVREAVETYAVVLDSFADDTSDAAANFARSFRLTGRLQRVHPQTSRVLLAHAEEISRSSSGIAAHARRDIAAAHDAGQFSVPDVDLAMVVVTGAMVELGRLLLDEPGRDAATTTDGVTKHVLLSLGMTHDRASTLCDQPLPDVPPLPM
ncbi:TetR/AcrR family transcriptional regulator [Aeromicrobium endophyticum]|uniref:TetR/AcrR family transcriptional regulator n=1 Tax=Aeromicrobium endophyticum TaxID=2292704 RepID=A0A371P3H3_9ACTN|nr:TetR/AcrR family transcriptional regulator [Aeromicrobium endophyticum]REK70497.1 TetR/AcrR family transcriptional regulator [Aeromicrobium endophyticum]